MALKAAHQAIKWLVEHRKPQSVGVLAPDTKGNIANLVVPALMAGRRIARYVGVGVPEEVRRALTGAHPGLLFENLASPAVVNCDLLFAEEGQRNLAWHAPVLLTTGSQPLGGSLVAQEANQPSTWVLPAQALPPRKFQVKTKNCVVDEEIQKNVLYSLSLGLPQLPRCSAHGIRAHVISAGPSLANHIAAIESQGKSPQTRIVAVKHSHDMLLDRGVKPWATVLLDPRAHVKDFIEDPQPEILYFVSSTCHPSTFDRLLSRNANVWLYHALVGAGEEPLIRMWLQTTRKGHADQRALASQLGLTLAPPSPYLMADQMVSGGTTAASRGISVLHMLGFRWFGLWAFDSCFWEPKDTKALKSDGQPEYHELTLAGRKWFTTAEHYAQVQDFMHMLPAYPDCTFEPYGDGMVPALVRQTARPMVPLASVFPEAA